MDATVIHDLPEWRVMSWGKGLAYEIEHKPDGRSLYFQGDDAAQFRDEFDSLTSGTPSLDFADALRAYPRDYNGEG